MFSVVDMVWWQTQLFEFLFAHTTPPTKVYIDKNQLVSKKEGKSLDDEKLHKYTAVFAL